MKKLLFGIAGAVLVAAAAITNPISAEPAEACPPHPKVTLCHRTASHSNPYVRITVDCSAVDGYGQNDHTHHTGPIYPATGPDGKWGDIIPAQPCGQPMNWTQEGQAIWNNGCNIPTPTPSPTPTATATPTPTPTSTPTPTPTASPTPTPEPITTPIVTPTPEPTPALTPTPTDTSSVSPTSTSVIRPISLPNTGGAPSDAGDQVAAMNLQEDFGIPKWKLILGGLGVTAALLFLVFMTACELIVLNKNRK